jgi:hypothetical protein
VSLIGTFILDARYKGTDDANVTSFGNIAEAAFIL